MSELAGKLDEFLCLYEEIKREIRSRNKHLYEQWKAGGFLIDSDILSMYPHIQKVVEQLEEDNEDEEDEDEEEENEE
jgi:hypothetical protein